MKENMALFMNVPTQPYLGVNVSGASGTAVASGSSAGPETSQASVISGVSNVKPSSTPVTAGVCEDATAGIAAVGVIMPGVVLAVHIRLQKRLPRTLLQSVYTQQIDLKVLTYK
jgi:hypothetical protein